MAYDGYSMTSAPLNYAVQQGIFKRFGLDITPIFIEGGSMLTQAVVGGSLDVAQNGYTPAIAAAVQGADVVIIGGIANTLPYQLVVKAEITSAAAAQGQEHRHQPVRLVHRRRRRFRAQASRAHAQGRQRAPARRRLRRAWPRPSAGRSTGTVRAISRHRGADAAGLSGAGRLNDFAARLSQHVVMSPRARSLRITPRSSRNS